MKCLRIVAVAAALGFSSLAGGCATMDTVAAAEAAGGVENAFDAPYGVVKAAATEAVERLNVSIQGADETPERYQIRFSKPVSAFSWGEVGVVEVRPAADGAAVVTVRTSKRNQGQITGTNEAQFAAAIFANLREAIARLQVAPAP